MTTKSIEDQAWSVYPYTWRNNRGAVMTKRGYLRFGWPPPPSGRAKDTLKGGDRIGFSPTVITPDMVGKTIAIFTNLEIKGPGDRLDPGQARCHNFVLRNGGISEIWYPDKTIKMEVEE